MTELNEETRCEIVKSIIQQFNDRAVFGEKKYGMTLSENDADIIERFEHFKQENMDAVLYAEWIIRKIKQISELLARITELEFELSSVCQSVEPIGNDCGNCEKTIESDYKFCPHCGCKIKQCKYEVANC